MYFSEFVPPVKLILQQIFNILDPNPLAPERKMEKGKYTA